MTETTISAASTRSVDLRVALGRHYGFDFANRVRASGAPSLASIYLVRSHVDTIAEDFDVSTDGNIGDVRERIRDEIGRDPRDGKPFDWRELEAIIEYAGIDDPDLEFDESLPAESRSIEFGETTDGAFRAYRGP